MRVSSWVSLAVVASACDRDILVGADFANDGGAEVSVGTGDDVSAGGDGPSGGKDAATDTATDAGADSGLGSLTVPWSTGFENGFGDWSQPSDQGYCYVAGAATYAIVTSPVHSGQYAAAFTVNPAITAPSQTRCVRQGALPASAYYGAWYYVPAVATSIGTWNLLHFQGADSPDAAVQSLWDLSLVNGADGGLAPAVYDFLHTRTLAAGPDIPIGSWFHLEVRLTRSASSAGAFAVYVNGNPVLALSALETDPTAWGQWYVGNYATALLPSPSTVYVDDVTIETTGP